MSRGLSEKVIFRIRKDEHEEADRAKLSAYLDSLKRGKENKGVKFYGKETDGDKYSSYEILLLGKVADEVVANNKKFNAI